MYIQPSSLKWHLVCKGKLMRYFLSFILVLVYGSVLQGQAKLVVDKELHNYGKFYETDKAICLFTLSNIGSDTLLIGDVTPECGCTVPDISKKVIPPGESAVMKVKYKAKGRIGQFSKKIAIYSNSNPAVTMVYIAGEVEPDQNRKFNQIRTPSNLYLNNQQINLDTLHDEEVRQFSIVIVNDGNRDHTILGYQNLPVWVTANTNKPINLKPGEQKELLFKVRGNRVLDYGQMKKYFFIRTNDKASPSKMILVQAFITPYFATPPKSKKKLKKWKLTQPKAIVSHSIIKYGTINSGARTKDTIHLRNSGGDTLKVKKIFSPCACLSLSVSNGQIAPGEMAIITVIFDSINRKGRQQKSGYILLNDPYLKKWDIYIDGEVKR